jgi:hypothetical protein
MHSIWFDLGLVLFGAVLATLIIGCFFAAHRLDQRDADERKRARLEASPGNQ